jgi:hypothetical protein
LVKGEGNPFRFGLILFARMKDAKSVDEEKRERRAQRLRQRQKQKQTQKQRQKQVLPLRGRMTREVGRMTRKGARMQEAEG